MDEFFILIVVAFWILSGIVNAIQRKMSGGGREEDDVRLGEAGVGEPGGRAPGPVQARIPRGSTEGMTAEDFLKRIEAGGQLPTLDAEPSAEVEGTSPPSRPAPRPAPVPDEPRGEPRSERWMAGSRGDAGRGAEAAPLEGISAETDTGDRVRKPEPPRARVRVPDEAAAARVARPRPGLAGPGGLAARTPSTTARAGRPVPSDLRDLAGLSRSELRRILVLQEVLGPPLALREKPPGSPAPDG